MSVIDKILAPFTDAERYRKALERIAKHSRDPMSQRLAERALRPGENVARQEAIYAEQRRVREKKREVLNSIGAGARWFMPVHGATGYWVRPLSRGVDDEAILIVKVTAVVGDARLTSMRVGDETTVHAYNLMSAQLAEMRGIVPT